MKLCGQGRHAGGGAGLGGAGLGGAGDGGFGLVGGAGPPQSGSTPGLVNVVKFVNKKPKELVPFVGVHDHVPVAGAFPLPPRCRELPTATVSSSQAYVYTASSPAIKVDRHDVT